MTAKLPETASKTCPKCNISLPRVEFKKQGYCPSCWRAYIKSRYVKRDIERRTITAEIRNDEPILPEEAAKADELLAAAARLGQALLPPGVIRTKHCACCRVSGVELSETDQGVQLCDLCGYYATRCGVCVPHGGTEPYCPEKVGQPVPELLPELIDYLAQPPKKSPPPPPIPGDVPDEE